MPQFRISNAKCNHMGWKDLLSYMYLLHSSLTHLRQPSLDSNYSINLLTWSLCALFKCCLSWSGFKQLLDQWRTQKIFMGGFVQGRMVVICIWCALFVTSQFDVIFMFPNQRFGEVCWHNMHTFLHPLPLFLCHCSINYQRSKLRYRRKTNTTQRRSSS